MAEVFTLCRFDLPKDPFRAVNWATIGDAVLFSDVRPGDVLVFKRPGGYHVTLFVSKRGSVIYCLGGNQNNRVNIGTYDLSDLLHVRRVRPKTDPVAAA
jgi:uncharacterized protein YfaT (DUF1175 family)